MGKEVVKLLFSFDKNKDADILADIQEAKQDGITTAEWTRDLFDSKRDLEEWQRKESERKTVSIKDVKSLLWAFRVHPNVINSIVRDLGGE